MAHSKKLEEENEIMKICECDILLLMVAIHHPHDSQE
jgi:hypothetical protein